MGLGARASGCVRALSSWVVNAVKFNVNFRFFSFAPPKKQASKETSKRSKEVSASLFLCFLGFLVCVRGLGRPLGLCIPILSIYVHVHVQPTILLSHHPFFPPCASYAATTSAGACTSSISTPSPDSGAASFPFGWMKQTSCPAAPFRIPPGVNRTPRPPRY